MVGIKELFDMMESLATDYEQNNNKESLEKLLNGIHTVSEVLSKSNFLINRNVIKTTAKGVTK